MPTDLPPDYVPQPPKDPDSPKPPGGPIDPNGPPGKGGDVVDPPGWKQPPATPDDVPLGVPTPAGTPTF